MSNVHVRRLLSLVAVTCVAAVAHDAHAADAPTFAELPVGRLTSPPSAKVHSVGGRESVPGLFVVWPSYNNSAPPQARYVVMTTDARIAAATKGNGPSFNHVEDVPSGCVSEMRNSFGSMLGDEDGKQPREWEENLSHEAHAYPRSADNPMSGVMAIHSERIVEANGATTLESVDAWVDPATRGARLIGKASLPLKLVRTPIFGLKVYAGRDERPDGRRFVQFIVVRPKVSSPTGRTSQMWSLRPEGSVNHSSGCGHARVALPADTKVGETATFVATVLLPSLDGTEPTVAKVEVKPEAKPRAAAALVGRPSGDGKEREFRARMMHLQVSVSQTSREKDPLVSVSSSWAGREQVERVGDPNSPF